MKKLGSSFFNMIIVLVTVAVVMGGLLAWINHITKDPVKMQEQKILSDGISSVMGSTDVKISSTDSVCKEIDGQKSHFVVYNIISDEKHSIGIAVESCVAGFGGNMKVLVGFDGNANILGYSILQSAETPGLGSKADIWFQKKGKGCIIGKNMNVEKTLTVKNDGGDIDAITASTITSRAFLKAVNEAYAVFKDVSMER